MHLRDPVILRKIWIQRSPARPRLSHDSSDVTRCYASIQVDSSRFSRFRLRLQQACKRQNCCANPLSGLDWRLLVKRYDRCDCVLQLVNRLCKLRRCCHKDVSKRRKLKQIMCQRGDLLKASAQIASLNRFNLGRPGAHLSRACWTNQSTGYSFARHARLARTTPSFEILLENMESGRKWQNLKSEDGWAPNMDKQWQTENYEVSCWRQISFKLELDRLSDIQWCKNRKCKM